MSQRPSIGRIVHYKLSAQDADAINRRRTDAKLHRGSKADGDQVHTGNTAYEGDIFPMLITRVWDHGQPDSTPILVNGQVFLDGNDVLWATSVGEGDGVRHYQWPTREGARS